MGKKRLKNKRSVFEVWNYWRKWTHDSCISSR